MKKILILLGFLAATFTVANAQHFEIMEFSKGYFTPAKNVKVTKIHHSKIFMPLASFDFDKDGFADTLYYRLVEINHKYSGRIEVLDVVEDDWRVLYEQPIAEMESNDGIWLYELNFEGDSTPEYIIYTGTREKKYATVLRFNQEKKQFSVKEYQFNPKTFFPHRFVANKKKFINFNGEDEQTFEEIPL